MQMNLLKRLTHSTSIHWLSQRVWLRASGLICLIVLTLTLMPARAWRGKPLPTTPTAAAAALQGGITLDGPRQFNYQPGPARTIYQDIPLPLGASVAATLRVQNGDAGGNNRVAGALIQLNGAVLTTARTLNAGVAQLDVPVTVGAANSLSVRLTGAPGSVVNVLLLLLTPLQITVLVPASGNPGATIAIQGTGFDPRTPNQNTVRFTKTGGGTTVANVTAFSTTQLSVVVPADAATGLVSVQNQIGTVNSPSNFTVSGALIVNAGPDQTITLPSNVALNGSVTGGTAPLNTAWSKVSGPGSVLFSNASATATNAMFALNGVYVLRLSATDALTTVNDDIQVTVNADPTPPPVLTAPPLDTTVVTTVGDGTEFLYTGPNPIQTGVAPGTINKMRAAVLKGRVLDKNNQPLPLVKVTVLNHPEYGQTLSRADGKFDLVVNGGGVLTAQYEKGGYQTVQRTDDVPWQNYCGIPDVVLIGYDVNVTLVDLLANTPVQVAQSSINTDTSGTRRTALLFKQGTTATMKLPGGAMAGLSKLSVRATEFTVGANGQQAMPGSLPTNSGYTYAVDYSIDEALAAGALETTFNQPVAQYNENFLHFAVGTVIPSGAYDPTTGQWVASSSGRVVKILSVSSGTANLDVNGAGAPATDPEYAALGINTAERQALATLYAVNQSLWRVPVIHFTKWDSNWPISPPPAPQGGPPSGPPPECDT